MLFVLIGPWDWITFACGFGFTIRKPYALFEMGVTFSLQIFLSDLGIASYQTVEKLDSKCKPV